MESFLDILGVVYTHAKTADGGEIYLTCHGMQHAEALNIENWYEDEWFSAKSVRLIGTSAVYRVPTKDVNGRRLQLVVKNCRVGEDVPVDTHTLEQFVNAEFNSPWEEFSLVMEMRERPGGTGRRRIGTQKPLAIYVPPERLQLWQTGRSRTKINKITRRHPGVALDILRQYKLVYQWIEGLDIVQVFEEIGLNGGGLNETLKPITAKVIEDMDGQGFVVADMKAAHIIIGEEQLLELRRARAGQLKVSAQCELVRHWIDRGCYSVIDYELLLRTPAYEAEVKATRRHSYLDDQRDRFVAAPLPAYLQASDIMGVPFVHGHVESTGGMLWVIGRNPRLFDYFLPERWRKTPCRALSDRHEVFYTFTKDNVHIVWKTSRVGETPGDEDGAARAAIIKDRGFNSPFEECAIASYISEHGIPSVYMRAIYMTGSAKVEAVNDMSRFESHETIAALDGQPILRPARNYISIRGFYNGPDSWVASHEGPLYEPVDLKRAAERGLLPPDECRKLLDVVRARLKNIGYDGSLLELNDLLLAVDQKRGLVMDCEGLPEARVCNFELLYRR